VKPPPSCWKAKRNRQGPDRQDAALPKPAAAEPFIPITARPIRIRCSKELFGYEKGAVTDARAQKRGIFELADKGTFVSG